jgi:hypothetical protein
LNRRAAFEAPNDGVERPRLTVGNLASLNAAPPTLSVGQHRTSDGTLRTHEENLPMTPYRFHPHPYPFSVLLICALLLVTTSAPAQGPGVEGTYRLVSRTLPDGKVQSPPDVIGLMTYTKGYRNFNILSKDADGQLVSRSIVSTYTLTRTEYVETTLFHILVRGQDVRRELNTPPQRFDVTVDGGRIQFRLERRLAVRRKELHGD